MSGLLRLYSDYIAECIPGVLYLLRTTGVHNLDGLNMRYLFLVWYEKQRLGESSIVHQGCTER